MARSNLVLVVLLVATASAAAQPGPDGAPGPDAWADHRGVTFEANLGAGVTHVGDQGNDVPPTWSHVGFGGLDVGAGAFVTPQLALTVRIAGVTAHAPGVTPDYLVNGLLGVSAQYWVTPRVWAGAGIGVGVFDTGESGCATDSGKCQYTGLGFDVRAGVVVFQAHRQTANVSFELVPAHYSPNASFTAVSPALLFGYQFL